MKLHRLAAPAIAIALTATLAACGSDDSSSAHTTPATQAPGGSAAADAFNAGDIKFAQGMIAHHEQAIEMAGIALDPKIGASTLGHKPIRKGVCPRAACALVA